MSFSDFAVYYLPVCIPLMLTLLAIANRIGIEGFSGQVLLKSHHDVLLGSLSFCVWAMITFFQTARVSLNAELLIPFEKIIFFLMTVLILLFVDAGMARHRWGDSPTWPQRRREKTWNLAMLVISGITFLAPIRLTSPIPKPPEQPAVGRFSVAVPYDDPSIPRHVGPSRWAGRRLCDVTDLEARDVRSAKTEAVKRFRESGRAFEVFGKNLQASVQVREDLVTAEVR